MFADRHPILSEQILLIQVFDEFAIHFAGYRDIVVEPAFSCEKVLEEFLIVHVLVKINGLFDEIADRPKEKKCGLQKFRRTIAESIDEFIHVEIFRPGPEIEQTILRRKINWRREED